MENNVKHERCKSDSLQFLTHLLVRKYGFVKKNIAYYCS